jgi:hypothetical protein
MVHIAPAYGEEDKVVTDAAGIDPVTPVNSRGEFDAQVPPYEGMHVCEANKAIIKDLRTSGALLRHDTYQHSYPHCWRCDNPLIQRAVSSWFVAVTRFRDRMVELNKQIRWVPEHIRDGQFGKWLENARDWSISRIAVGPCDPRVGVGRSVSPPDVYGSLTAPATGVKPDDLHRPGVDALTLNPTTRRAIHVACGGWTAGSIRVVAFARCCSSTRTGSSILSGRLHRRVQRPDAQVTRCHQAAAPPTGRTARVWRTDRVKQRRAEDIQVA